MGILSDKKYKTSSKLDKLILILDDTDTKIDSILNRITEDMQIAYKEFDVISHYDFFKELGPATKTVGRLRNTYTGVYNNSQNIIKLSKTLKEKTKLIKSNLVAIKTAQKSDESSNLTIQINEMFNLSSQIESLARQTSTQSYSMVEGEVGLESIAKHIKELEDTFNTLKNNEIKQFLPIVKEYILSEQKDFSKDEIIFNVKYLEILNYFAKGILVIFPETTKLTEERRKILFDFFKNIKLEIKKNKNNFIPKEIILSYFKGFDSNIKKEIDIKNYLNIRENKLIEANLILDVENNIVILSKKFQQKYINSISKNFLELLAVCKNYSNSKMREDSINFLNKVILNLAALKDNNLGIDPIYNVNLDRFIFDFFIENNYLNTQKFNDGISPDFAAEQIQIKFFKKFL